MRSTTLTRRLENSFTLAFVQYLSLILFKINFLACSCRNTTIIGNMSSDKLSRAIDDDRNLHRYVYNIHCLTFSLRYSREKTFPIILVTRSYIENLLSSSFVIWIDEQKREKKRRANMITNTV